VIPSLVGWSMELLPRGLAMTHPDGAATGTILYRERAQPLRRLGVLLHEVLATLPRFEVDHIGAPERVMTYDGEYGALVTVRGTQAGRPAQRDFGFVFGDDFFSSVGGLCLVDDLRPSFTDIVRELVRQDVHALGLRRRRFEYQPPPGWQPVPRGMATEWLPPDYPRNLTWLMAYAANPKNLVPGVSLAASVVYLEQLGHRIEDRSPPEDVAVGSLTGQRQVIRTAPRDGKPPLVREVVLLEDQRYVYAFELSSYSPPHHDAARAALDGVLATVRPLPAPSPIEAAASTLAHWVD